MSIPTLVYTKDDETKRLVSEDKAKGLFKTYNSLVLNTSVTEPASISIWVEELKSVLKYSLPLVFTFLLGTGNRVWDVWFLGKAGSQAMAVASLAHLFTTVAGLSIGSGILTAIDTLVAQAFTGAKYPQTIGIIFQRALCVIFLFGALVTILWLNAEPILISMGQDPALVTMAYTSILIAIPYMFIYFTNVALRKFLQSIGEMRITMYLIFITFPINIISNYFLLIYLELGYIGAALQLLMTSFILLLLYVFFLSYFTQTFQTYWPGFTKEAFHNWGEYLKLGIPGMLSVSTEWAFEVCALLTGVLGQSSLAAQSVVLTVNSLLLMICNALSAGMGVRLGHLLGANEPKKSWICVTLSTCLGALIALCNATGLFLFRFHIAHHFSKDPQIIEAIQRLLQVACLCHFTMGFSVVLSHALNALGKQRIVASLNLISYYIIGLPFGLYLTQYHQWGLEGVWFGVVVSGLVKSICEFIIICRINWDHECQLAAQRINDQEYVRV